MLLAHKTKLLRDMLYLLEPDSLYEAQNLIGTEPEQAEVLWHLLDATYHLPAPQTYIPLMAR